MGIHRSTKFQCDVCDHEKEVQDTTSLKDGWGDLTLNTHGEAPELTKTRWLAHAIVICPDCVKSIDSFVKELHLRD